MSLGLILILNDQFFLVSDNIITRYDRDLSEFKNLDELINAEKVSRDAGSKIIQLSENSALTIATSSDSEKRYFVQAELDRLNFTDDPDTLSKIPGLVSFLVKDDKAYFISLGKVREITARPQPGRCIWEFSTIPYANELVKKVLDENLSKLELITALYKSIQDISRLTKGCVGPIPHIATISGGRYKCLF